MTIGGYNLAYHEKNQTVQTAPFHTERGQYRVHLNKIEVFFPLIYFHEKFEGEDLQLGESQLNAGQGTFFDSGTTLFYAAGPTYQ